MLFEISKKFFAIIESHRIYTKCALFNKKSSGSLVDRDLTFSVLLKKTCRLIDPFIREYLQQYKKMGE